MPLPDEPASAAGSSARHKKWSKSAGGTPCLLPDRGSGPAKLAKRDRALCSTRNSSDGWAPKEFPALAASCRNRSEEHTSELQSLAYLVCRLLLEKKKK